MSEPLTVIQLVLFHTIAESRALISAHSIYCIFQHCNLSLCILSCTHFVGKPQLINKFVLLRQPHLCAMDSVDHILLAVSSRSVLFDGPPLCDDDTCHSRSWKFLSLRQLISAFIIALVKYIAFWTMHGLSVGHGFTYSSSLVISNVGGQCQTTFRAPAGFSGRMVNSGKRPILCILDSPSHYSLYFKLVFNLKPKPAPHSENNTLQMVEHCLASVHYHTLSFHSSVTFHLCSLASHRIQL